MTRILLPFLLAILAFPRIGPCQSLLFLYPNRAPYNYTVDGKAAGILVQQIEAITRDAGIEPRFEEAPSQRIIAEVFRENSTTCSFGWFKKPDRVAKARFTLPTYRDTRLVALALISNRHLFEGKITFQDIASDKRLIPGLIQGWSYGETVGGLLKMNAIVPVDTLDRDSQALMLAYERFTYTLIREAEIPDFVRLSGKLAEDFLIIPLPDLNQTGSYRHIICGKGIPQETIEQLDASIARVCPLDDE